MLDLNGVVEAHGGLATLLERLPDPRQRRGIRHRHAVVLAVAICACLAGARGFVAIGEGAGALPQEALRRLGCRWHAVRRCYVPPSEPTRRRALPAGDGKSVRGAVGQHGKPRPLLSALVHKEGVVVGQRLVDTTPNEITEFKPLLDPLELTGKVVTADARHTQREHARFLVNDKHADYLFTIKSNQPALLADLEALDQGAFSPSGSDDCQGPRPA